MKNYLIKKKNKHNEIVYMEYSLPGYNFSPKKNVSFLNVKNVKIVDPKLNDIILTTKFEESFKKILIIASNYINDDDGDDETGSIVLDEITRIKSILLNKYQNYLSAEKEELFLKKLKIVEQKVRVKEIQFKETELLKEMQEKNNKSM